MRGEENDMKQKGQKLTLSLISYTRDCFGVYEIRVLINGKSYTYPINSEYIFRKIKKMIRLHKPGKAIHLLSAFKTKGFNYFEERRKNGAQSSGDGISATTGNKNPGA